MLIKLGDGRVVECAKGITKLPPGPMPERLASEVTAPIEATRSDPNSPDVRSRKGGLYPTEGLHAPVPAMLQATWAPAAPPADTDRAPPATRKRGSRSRRQPTTR